MLGKLFVLINKATREAYAGRRNKVNEVRRAEHAYRGHDAIVSPS